MSFMDGIHKIGFWGKKHSPQIATGLSVAGSVGAVVFAFIKADKVKQKIQDHKDRMEELHANIEMMGDELSKTEVSQLKTAEFIKTGLEVAKEVWPIILLEAVAVGGSIFSQVVMDKRYGRATTALAAVTSAFSIYRNRVAEKFGKEAEEELYLGESEEEVEYVEIDEENNEVKKKKAIRKFEAATPYCFVFEDFPRDEFGSIKTRRVGTEKFNHYENNQFRLDFVKGIRAQCHRMLHARGKLYLCEVFDLLGYEGYLMDEDELAMAREVGWVVNKDCQAGDDFITFGIEDGNAKHVRDFVEGKDNFLFLSFNCMGSIYGEIPKQYTGATTFFRDR